MHSDSGDDEDDDDDDELVKDEMTVTGTEMSRDGTKLKFVKHFFKKEVQIIRKSVVSSA